jgi:hypothetical protein
LPRLVKENQANEQIFPLLIVSPSKKANNLLEINLPIRHATKIGVRNHLSKFWSAHSNDFWRQALSVETSNWNLQNLEWLALQQALPRVDKGLLCHFFGLPDWFHQQGTYWIYKRSYKDKKLTEAQEKWIFITWSHNLFLRQGCLGVNKRLQIATILNGPW